MSPRVFTVKVPQGVGDILWVYQKLTPYCDRIRFLVYDGADLPRAVTRRSLPLVRCLPQVESVEFFRADGYPPELGEKRHVVSVVDEMRAGREMHYAVNPWLEDGTPIEQIEPILSVNWDFGVTPERPADFPVAEGCEYVTLYVSGDAVRHASISGGTWSPDQWVECLTAIYAGGSVSAEVPVVVVGSAFDYPVSAYVRDRLIAGGLQSHCVQDLSLGELWWLFRHTRLFVGYQSGLNVVAGLAGAKQMMVYFSTLPKMGDTWTHPDYRASGRFRWAWFHQTPAAVAASACELDQLGSA